MWSFIQLIKRFFELSNDRTQRVVANYSHSSILRGGESVDLDYKINSPITVEEVANVFQASGIKRPVHQLERIQRMIDNADITITVWDGDKLIGIARTITDYSYCCYLSDLAVDKAYQKRGIGKQLIKELKKQLNEEISLLLLAAPNAMDYYPRVGFNKTENAFLIQRER